jgi:SNF2 family DNA or RNA helicase
MNRTDASQFLRDTLNQYKLTDWRIRLTNDADAGFLGMCVHKDKTIILNAHHIDIHGAAEVRNTILHEVAHAIVGPGHGHNDTWAAKAKEIGCDNTLPCSHLDLPAHVIDAIRSGATVEMTVEEETHVIRKPKFQVRRIQDECPFCHKPAKEKFAFDSVDKQGNQIRMTTLECFHVITKIIPKATDFESMVSNDWRPEIKSCKHEWIKNQCSKCKEYKLYNFQVTGARFAETALIMQKGVGIFDDMGLGKTVQGLAIPRFHKQYLPFLVITKSAVTYQWFSQIVRWLGPDHFSQIIKTGRDVILPGLKSYIIPYDLLRRLPEAKLKYLQENLKLVILDECQQIKNPDSSRTQEVRKILKSPSMKVIELSGTPWKNRGSEFFPALNMLDPIKFHSYQAFLDNWVEFYFEGNKRKQGGIRNIAKFKEYTKSLVIRREFNEVMDEFPDINRVKLNVQLDELTQSTYDDTVSEFVAWYNDYVISGEEDNISGIEILAKMARMRHITGIAKIPATLGFIEEFVEDTDKKLVVFVHHLDVAKLMEYSLTTLDKDTNSDWYDLAQSLRDENIPVFMYHSGLNSLQRNELQNKFNNAKRSIMIASTLACGEGVDLQTCSDCVLHERQWNPQNEEQAAPGRFRRIGQTASVINITVPEAEGTIDEHLDMLIEKKRLQFHNVMNKGQVPTWNNSDIGKQLAEIIVTKHNQKFKGKPKNKITAKAKIVPRQSEQLVEW